MFVQLQAKYIKPEWFGFFMHFYAKSSDHTELRFKQHLNLNPSGHEKWTCDPHKQFSTNLQINYYDNVRRAETNLSLFFPVLKTKNTSFLCCWSLCPLPVMIQTRWFLNEQGKALILKATRITAFGRWWCLSFCMWTPTPSMPLWLDLHCLRTVERWWRKIEVGNGSILVFSIKV